MFSSAGFGPVPDDAVHLASVRGALDARDRYQLQALPSRAVSLSEIEDDVIRSAAERVRISARFSMLRWINWDESGYLSFGTEL
jgi:hypothetical protein